MITIEDTLDARLSNYGDFPENARVTQSLKQSMRDSENWDTLSPDKCESLERIAMKIGRILTGDAEHLDSWHDIQGYARLVELEILDNQKEQ